MTAPCSKNAPVSDKIGETPDWAGLIDRWGPTALLHMDASLLALTVRAGGKVVYLATPFQDYCDGSALAAGMADEWRRTLIGQAKVRCYSPAGNAQAIADFAGGPVADCKPKLATEMRLVDLVVVPPMAGWDASVEVWRAVQAALSLNMPVYVLANQAGAM